MTETLSGYFLAAGEGIGDSSIKASGAVTGGNLTLIESRTTGGAPLHIHTREDEYFYVVEGTLTVRLGDKTFEAGPRSFVFCRAIFRTNGMWSAKKPPCS